LAVGNPKWMGKDIESFVFVGLVYFTICFAVSRMSRRLEAKYRVAAH